MKKRKWLVVVAAIMVLLAVGIISTKATEENAVKRVQAFAYEINYNYKHPENAYQYLCEDFRSQMTKVEFVEAFNKERSYPYLTPLFINYESIEMADDCMNGTAFFSQAARLPGMIYELPIIYENGDYYVIAFEEFLDGSYLDKFNE